MCYIIMIGEDKEIETPREFENHFGFLPLKNEYYKEINLDYCLCQCDIEETFKQKNINYEKDFGYYYIK